MTESKNTRHNKKSLKVSNDPEIKKISPLLHLGNIKRIESQNARIKDVDHVI